MFDDGCFENVLVVTNGSVIAILQEGLEVCFGCGSVAERRGADSEDAVQIGPDVSINDWFEFGQDGDRVEVGVSVRTSDPADDSGDVAVEVEETGGGHGFPVGAYRCNLFPVWLEALERAEIDTGVFFNELLELSGSEGGALEDFEVASGDETAFEDGEEYVAEAFLGIERMGGGILTKVLGELNLNAVGQESAGELVKLGCGAGLGAKGNRGRDDGSIGTRCDTGLGGSW